MPLKTYFQTFVLQTSEDQRSNVEDEVDQRSNDDQILIVDDDDDQTSNLYNEGQSLKRLSKDHSLTKNKDDQSLKNKGQILNVDDDDQTSNTKGNSKRKRPISNPNTEDQRQKRLFEDQSIPMEECSDSDNLEIINFVSSNTSGTNEQLSTSSNCLSVKSPVAKSPFSQLSSENDSKHDKLATLKTYYKNRKSNKTTFQKATTQNYTSNQMSQPNCLTVKQEIKKEREEEEDITIEDTSNPKTKTQNNQMSLTNCPNTSDEDISIEDPLSFSSDSNTTSQNDSLTSCLNTSDEDISIEDPSSFSSDSNTTSQNDSLTNCPNDSEMTFEESPLFSSSTIKVEESQIIEFPSFSDESQNDTSMESSGKTLLIS
jgi:hypothetical protein